MAQTVDLQGLVRPHRMEAVRREDNPNFAEFHLQPLERGFGHTLGNAMRRMLLSSLRGAAVWGFRIDGVVHEHQTIPGVVEDVHQIIANLKALTLSLDPDVEATTVVVTKRGTGAVTAAEIGEQRGVRVVDPSHHLFTLQEDREIRMELYVNKGRGYVEADQHPLEKGVPVDLVRIDAIYNPVRRTNFSVAETRVGQRTDYDRLTLVVETNGTISPEEAVSYAAALAQTHFQHFTSFGSHVAAPQEGAVDYVNPTGMSLEDTLNFPLELSRISVRAKNSLKNVGIRTLGELARQNEEQMLRIKNLGRKSLNEIIDILEEHHLNFGMRFENGPNGVRVIDRGTPPNRSAVPMGGDEGEEEEEEAMAP